MMATAGRITAGRITAGRITAGRIKEGDFEEGDLESWFREWKDGTTDQLRHSRWCLDNLYPLIAALSRRVPRSEKV